MDRAELDLEAGAEEEVVVTVVTGGGGMVMTWSGNGLTGEGSDTVETQQKGCIGLIVLFLIK